MAHISTHPHGTIDQKQKTGIAATVAIVGALGSFILSFTGHPYWGMLMTLVAIIAGLFGVAMSASPKIGGGLLSVVSIILGVIGFIIAILVMVGVILF